MKIWINISLVLSALLSATLCFGQEAAYYRYKDKDGNTVMSSTLPPEYANGGYETLNHSGAVIETIAPRKSEAQIQIEAEALKKREADKQQAELQHQKDEEQRRKDDILLKSFSTQQDIERSRNDKMASIKVLEEIVKENLEGLERQLSVAQNAAKTYQQSNQKIPEKLQHTIDNTLRQIHNNKAFLERKALEKKDIDKKYQALIQRFNDVEKKRSTTVAPATAPATTPAQP
jgi:hypothetical protein